MPFTVFKELFSMADAKGSRSTALQPLLYMIMVVLVALLFAALKGFPVWLLIILVLFLAGCICLFGYSYFHLLHNNLDALRSESFYLQKIAIEKGMTGDSVHGVFTPDENTQTKLIGAESQSRSDNET